MSGRTRIETKAERGARLAKAVLAFAEWQREGYEGAPEEVARGAITTALWEEVSEHVYFFTHSRPPLPGVDPSELQRSSL